MLQNIIDNTSACIYVKDMQGRYVHINRQFESVFHVHRNEVIGKTDFDIFPKHLAEVFQRNDRTVLQSGMQLECEEVAPHDDGPHTYLSIKVPLRNDNNEIFALAGISTDITERIRARQALEALQHRTELLLESVDDAICGVDVDGFITFMNPAAERLFDSLADRFVGQSLSLLLPSTDGETGPLREVLRSGQRRHVNQTNLHSCDGGLVPVEYDASPIYDGGKLTGAVVVFRDLRVRLDNERAKHDLLAASRVQQFLYPRTAPRIPGFDIAGGTYPSARVCGDYFDFIPWGPETWCLALGDVSGHGFGPALQMVETRAFLRAALQGTDSPSIALQRLNQALCVDLPEGMFVSLFVAQLFAETRRFCYASAGHPGGLLRSDGTFISLKSTGMLLGLIDSAAYCTTSMVDLHPGDTLVITSDGVAEMISPDKKLFGSERLWKTVAKHHHDDAAAIRDAIHHAAFEFAQNEPPHDDVTIIVAKCLP
jgi:PAS domain S-box-containing protein